MRLWRQKRGENRSSEILKALGKGRCHRKQTWRCTCWLVSPMDCLLQGSFLGCQGWNPGAVVRVKAGWGGRDLARRSVLDCSPELGKRREGQERGISQRGMDLRTVSFIRLGHLHVVKEPVESEGGKKQAGDVGAGWMREERADTLPGRI